MFLLFYNVLLTAASKSPNVSAMLMFLIQAHNMGSCSSSVAMAVVHLVVKNSYKISMMCITYLQLKLQMKC